MNRYKTFYAIFSQVKKTGAKLTKEEVVSEFTDRRTIHLSDLTDKELKDLETNLAKAVRKSPNQLPDKYDTPENRMRRKLIAIFKSIYGADAGAIAAKEWAEKQGVNGTKKPFNNYTAKELPILISIAEKKVKPDHIQAVVNRLNQL